MILKIFSGATENINIQAVSIAAFVGMEGILTPFTTKSIGPGFSAMVSAVKYILQEYESTSDYNFNFNIDMNKDDYNNFFETYSQELLLSMAHEDQLMRMYKSSASDLLNGLPLKKPGMFAANLGKSSDFVGFIVIKRINDKFKYTIYAFGAGFKSIDSFTGKFDREKGAETLSAALNGDKSSVLFESRVPVGLKFSSYASSGADVFYTPLELLLCFLCCETKLLNSNIVTNQEIFFNVFKIIIKAVISKNIQMGIDQYYRVIGIIRKFYILCFPEDANTLMNFEKNSIVPSDNNDILMDDFIVLINAFIKHVGPAIDDENGNPIKDPIHTEAIYRFISMGYRNGTIKDLSSSSTSLSTAAEIKAHLNDIADNIKPKLNGSDVDGASLFMTTVGEYWD